jgi:tetratricopeptide (TPR) repeat protein
MGFRRFRWLGAAHRRLPDYAPAQGHLAEVEAALGETDSAIARLRPLTITSDDPDYPAQLARILSEVGRVEEAREWRARAAARYDELLARHPEAFADHAGRVLAASGCRPAPGIVARDDESRGPPDTTRRRAPPPCHERG